MRPPSQNRRPPGQPPQPRTAPLDMDPTAFRQAGHELVDTIADFLGRLPRLPVNRDEAPRQIRELLPAGGVPEVGAEPGQLLRETARILMEHSLFNGHPRFFGYITSSAAPIGALADFLAAAINPNVGGWQLSPVASEIESQCVRWIAELMEFPAAGGLLVSGGNMANFVGFLAARRSRMGEALRQRGVDQAGGRWLAYASRETHTWIQKAADLFGTGTDSIRWVAPDAAQRMDLDALRHQITVDRQAGHHPFLLVGTAGTVGTGAVDPLPEMAELARREKLWFHVDGAYGAFAAMVPGAPSALAGISQADSVAVDPHKWLYAPMEAGCALVRDARVLEEAFSYTPPYYRFGGDDDDPQLNYYEIGMQNSRGFRALKVWLGLRQAGRAGYRQMLAEDMRLSRELHAAVERTPELEAVSQSLSISCFRFVPTDLAGDEEEKTASYLDELNEQLLAQLKASGELFLSNAVVDGRFLLRACIVNFRTSQADVEALPGIILRHGRQLDARRRGSGSPGGE